MFTKRARITTHPSNQKVEFKTVKRLQTIILSTGMKDDGTRYFPAGQRAIGARTDQIQLYAEKLHVAW